MKKRFIVLFSILIVFCLQVTAFSATVIKKEDAALFSKKSIYSDVGVEETISIGDSNENEGGMRQSDEALNKFSVVTATKNGDTYTNAWSNYKITIDEPHLTANDSYDFYADGMKFDFGVYFKDYSRIAVYYTRLAKDINVVAANFGPKSQVTDVVIAGETYKHVTDDVPYPYGIEKYEYYLRNIDGKLMVIELFYEDGKDISKKYIEEFERAKE